MLATGAAIRGSKRRRDRMGKIIPTKDKGPEFVVVTARVEKTVVEDIDMLAKAEGYSRNEAINFLLKWAVAEEKASSKGGKR